MWLTIQLLTWRSKTWWLFMIYESHWKSSVVGYMQLVAFFTSQIIFVYSSALKMSDKLESTLLWDYCPNLCNKQKLFWLVKNDIWIVPICILIFQLFFSFINTIEEYVLYLSNRLLDREGGGGLYSQNLYVCIIKFHSAIVL